MQSTENRPGKRSDRTLAGFSLLELLVVCLLLSLLLGLALPSLQWSLGNEPLKKGVRQVSVLLREARAQARREGVVGWLWFSQQEHKAGFRLQSSAGTGGGDIAGRELELPAGVEFGEVLVAGRQMVAEPVEVWVSPRGFLEETWLELRSEGSAQWLHVQPLIDQPELLENGPGRTK